MKLEELLKRETELSSLPEIYLSVSELLDSESSTAPEIGRVVETDPALSLRILKMVNSAFYGFPHQIDSIAQAITILGRERLKQILIGSVLSSVFGRMENRIFDMDEFWYHSIKTAILARFMSLQTGLAAETEALFTAGLLHNIGRLLFAKLVPEQAAEVQQAIDNDGESAYDAEQRIIGFTHCELGAGFIEKWGLPEILSTCTRHFHAPQQATEFQDAVTLIHISDGLTDVADPEEPADLAAALGQVNGWRELGLSPESISAACILADEQVRDVMSSFGMGNMTIDD